MTRLRLREDAVAQMPVLSEDAVLERAEGAPERRIDIRLVRWGEVAENTMEGIRETFEAGAFRGTRPERVVLESSQHGGTIVGAGVAIAERADDAVLTVRVAETPAGDELLTLTVPGPNGEPPILRDASVVFAPRRHRRRPDGVVVRTAVDLRRVAILPHGAYPSARVLAVRGEPDQEEVMHCDTCGSTHPEGQACTAPEPQAAPAAAVAVLERNEPDLSPLSSRLDQVESRVAVIESTPAGDGTHPLSDIPSLGVLVQRALDDRELIRTIADQNWAGNTGLQGGGPSWLAGVRGIVDLGRRAIAAFGGPRPMTPAGMTIDWPQYAGTLDGLITAQANELDEVASVIVDITAGQSAIATYAGGSKASYQLLRRSQPPYMDAYSRIMLAAWAKTTVGAFVARLIAAGTGVQAYHGYYGPAIPLATSAHSDDILDTTPDHGFLAGDRVQFTAVTGGDGTFKLYTDYFVVSTSLGDKTFRVAATPNGTPLAWGTADISAGTVKKVLATEDGTGLVEALFAASIQVEDATGLPASVCLASTDMFKAMARYARLDMRGGTGNTADAIGSALASTLNVNLSGLHIVREPSLPGGTLEVSNGEAAAWFEDGPFPISAEDVHHLGQDVAWWSLGSGAVFVPAGVVTVSA